MKMDTDILDSIAARLSDETLEHIEEVVERIVEVKERGGKVAVVTGSGPNIHEGVTTLIAELMRVGVVDAVMVNGPAATGDV